MPRNWAAVVPTFDCDRAVYGGIATISATTTHPPNRGIIFMSMAVSLDDCDLARCVPHGRFDDIEIDAVFKFQETEPSSMLPS